MAPDSRQPEIDRGLRCPGCDCPTVLKSTRLAAPDADGYTIARGYVCPRCGASVRCHPGTDRAMGMVADKETHRLRRKAHLWLDAIWKNHLKRSRYNAYSWLALRLDMNRDRVHIALFDKLTCLRVIDICSAYIRKHRPDLYADISASTASN